MSLLIAAALAPVGGVLYRLRGGWFSELSRKYGWEWGGKQRTHAMRLLWSIPTGALLFFGTTPDTEMWYRVFLCIVAVWASMALYGHGAHMIFDMKMWTIRWAKGEKVNTTELLTSWWLPKLFGGAPDLTWDNDKLVQYNLLGMGFIGLVRNLTAVLPIIVIAPLFCAVYVATGVAHGLLYWLGQKIVDWFQPLWLEDKQFHGGEIAEFIVGFVSYATIGAILYG